MVTVRSAEQQLLLEDLSLIPWMEHPDLSPGDVVVQEEQMRRRFTDNLCCLPEALHWHSLERLEFSE